MEYSAPILECKGFILCDSFQTLFTQNKKEFLHCAPVHTSMLYLHCCCSLAKSCPTLCDPMDCSLSGFPVLHCLLEFAQIHVHCVDDAIQPSHSLSLPSPALNLFQHHSLFQRAPKHSNMLALCYRTLFLPWVSLRLPQWSVREVRLWTFCGGANTTWYWCCPYFGLCCLPLSRLLWIPHKH